VSGAGPGRPTIYSEELAATICSRLADGESLRAICRDEGMPRESTVRAWALQETHPFYAQYARAREVAYHSMADELFEIADNGSNDWMERNDKDNPGYEANGEHMARSRLRVDTRKWALARMLPKIYGDKTENTTNLNAGGDLAALLARIATGPVFPKDDDAS
jgi:hypothetical protein